jgi:hypothetical protein
MSGNVTPALIAAIAESLGISSLSPEAASVLAPDVEYRVRDILQVSLDDRARGSARSACRGLDGSSLMEVFTVTTA